MNMGRVWRSVTYQWLACGKHSTSWRRACRSIPSSTDGHLERWIVVRPKIADNLCKWSIHGGTAGFCRWHRLEKSPLEKDQILFKLLKKRSKRDERWTNLGAFCAFGGEIVFIARYTEDLAFFGYKAFGTDGDIAWRAEEAALMELLSFVLHLFHA